MLLAENKKKLEAAGWNEEVKFFYRNPNSNYDVIVTTYGFAIFHNSNLTYGKHLAKFSSAEETLKWIENNEGVS